LYAARIGLKTIILEKGTIGGQVSITPIVENWPGFSSIPGQTLMDMISSQVREYVPLIQGEEIIEVKIGKNIEALSYSKKYIGKALILATGATHRKLGIPGEDDFYGRGVSYFATCDGYLFKNKKISVVGGVNTALTDALYLHNLGANVTIIHRRDYFSAEQYLIESVKRENIKILWDTEITKILGKEFVKNLNIKNKKSGNEEKIKTDAVFIAIGDVPNNNLALAIGLAMDKSGFLITDRYGRTNIPRIYAVGDLT
jgi:thioredoxin reductase (NADPH)